MYSTGYHDLGTPAPAAARSVALEHEGVAVGVPTHRELGTPPVERLNTVTLEIDGRTVTVPEGTSIMRAAALAGQDIPKLCATDTLKAFGSCRLCLV